MYEKGKSVDHKRVISPRLSVLFMDEGKNVNRYYSDMWSFTQKLSCQKLRISTLVLSKLFKVSIPLIREKKSSQVWKGKKGSGPGELKWNKIFRFSVFRCGWSWVFLLYSEFTIIIRMKYTRSTVNSPGQSLFPFSYLARFLFPDKPNGNFK